MSKSIAIRVLDIIKALGPVSSYRVFEEIDGDVSHERVMKAIKSLYVDGNIRSVGACGDRTTWGFVKDLEPKTRAAVERHA